MPASPTTKKPISKRKERRKEPLPADYQDEVTEEHLERIRAAVKPLDLKEAKVVSGPAW